MGESFSFSLSCVLRGGGNGRMSQYSFFLGGERDFLSGDKMLTEQNGKKKTFECSLV